MEENKVTEEQMAQLKKAQREVSELFYATFETEPGKKALAYLTKLCDRSSLVGNDFGDANVNVSATEFMFMREGHDQVIRFLHRMIAFYKENK